MSAISPEDVGLTGTSAEIAAVAQAFRVYYKKAGDGANYMMGSQHRDSGDESEFQFAGSFRATLPAQMIERSTE